MRHSQTGSQKPRAVQVNLTRLAKHRPVLIPILVCCEGKLSLLPEMMAPEKHRR